MVRCVAFLMVLFSVRAVAAPAVVRFQLSNGLRVLLRPVAGSQMTAVVVQFDLGGNHDPAGRSGLAHLVEHLYCTAATGASPARTAEQWMTAGGNAQTGEDYTFLAEQVSADRLNAVLEDSAARMQDLRLDAAVLEREKARLIAEVTNMFGGMPSLAATNLARERMRPTPNDGRRGGVPEQVSKVTLEEALERWKRFYKPANATLVVAGSFDLKTTRSTIERLFGPIPAGERAPAVSPPGQPQLGKVETVPVKALQSGAGAEACVVYAAPMPSSADYLPFLMVVTRMFPHSEELGAKFGQRFPPSVQYAVLEDPFVLCVGGPLRKGETPEQGVRRIRTFVAKYASIGLSGIDILAVQGTMGAFLGLTDRLDAQWAQNPYGLALSLARRERMGVDPASLKRTLERLTSRDLQRAITRIFSVDRSAAVVAVP